MTDPVDDLAAYLTASPSPWHAAAETARRLTAAGYRELDEREPWTVEAGDRVFVRRGGASLAAFQIGLNPPSESGFRLVGAHTDSPNLRVKPQADLEQQQVHQLAVEPYGGVLLHTWLDRDLGIAGRVFVEGAEGLEVRLIDVPEPVARVSSLAIHLNRKVNSEGLLLNKQLHMPPMIALVGETAFTFDGWLADRLGVEAAALRGRDLGLYDLTPPARGGARGELFFSGRLDNLASCHAGLLALLSADETAIDGTRGIVLYDHEEVGSQSAQGADGPFLAETLARLAHALDQRADAPARALARSFLISADMAHAAHPNYGEQHEPGHLPRLGAGPVIKSNVNQRYATDAESVARFVAWCAAVDVTPQHFVTRSDLACGSTIGPITAGRLGVRTIDVGNPMLSMHSAREMCGAEDHGPMIAVMTRFFTTDD
jgi:aspartyl aminopeptidase